MKTKFRIWDTSENEFVNYPVFISSEGGVYWEHYERGLQEDNSLKISLSTGKIPTNGKLIFEGDIVHFKTNGMSGLGFVYWNEELGQWWIKDIREVTKKRGQRCYPFWEGCEYRIDGNIYENPELLEELR